MLLRAALFWVLPRGQQARSTWALLPDIYLYKCLSGKGLSPVMWIKEVREQGSSHHH